MYLDVQVLNYLFQKLLDWHIYLSIAQQSDDGHWQAAPPFLSSQRKNFASFKHNLKMDMTLIVMINTIDG